MSRSSVHLIYTGGTIGMMADPGTGVLNPMQLEKLNKELPELNRLEVELTASTFMDPIDSCDMTPARLVALAARIAELYDHHDGFVVLHGSDTMAYGASALSFLLQGLQKPVILTGAQLPIGTLRTDGKENLLTAVEIAGSKKNGVPIVQEVAIYFEYKLYRGNRTIKVNAERFEAFRSPNWPVLAEAGVSIRYDKGALLQHKSGPLVLGKKLDPNVALVKLFPGMVPSVIGAFIQKGDVKAVVLETFGAGNVPSDPTLLLALRELILCDIPVVNVTQCIGGSVLQGRYGTSVELEEMGVISAHDMTTESAITKLMYLFGKGIGTDRIPQEMQASICGEVSISQL